MATNYYFFTGKAKWAKIRKPDPKYNNYSVQFYPDDETMKAIKASGVPSKPKVDLETKEIFYTFRRPVEKMIKNEAVTFGPPKVVNADGSDFEGLIGNGSTVTVKVSVFDVPATGGKGSRLEGIRVDELVVYTPPRQENEQGTGAAQQPGMGLPF